jgi:TetR/AcrR family transcriptional regulator, cholesterol catabolism regulator
MAGDVAPSARSGGPRRQALLDAAAEMFAERGYHGASMRDIATRCDLQAASLYSHFTGKEQILVELVERYTDALLPRLREIATQPVDGAARLAAMITASVLVAEAHRYEFLTFSHDWKHIRRTPELHELVERRDESIVLWRQVLADGIADGSIRADVPPAAVLWVIFAATTGMVDERYAESESPLPPPTAALVTMLLDGLRR